MQTVINEPVSRRRRQSTSRKKQQQHRPGKLKRFQEKPTVKAQTLHSGPDECGMIKLKEVREKVHSLKGK